MSCDLSFKSFGDHSWGVGVCVAPLIALKRLDLVSKYAKHGHVKSEHVRNMVKTCSTISFEISWKV